MPRSTIILAGVSVLLAVATGYAGWRWISAAPAAGPAVEGARLGVGLDELKPEIAKKLAVSPSALLWDSDASVILYEQNGFERRPIASLTKLMTAMVALDADIDLERELEIRPEEERIGGRLALAPDEKATVRDMMHASLMGSANNATLAYVRASGMTEREFVRAMNRKAIELGLEQTAFDDVTGLSDKNVSTAYEVARLAEIAFGEYPMISEVTSRDRWVYTIGGSGREHTILNTNNMIVDQGYQLSGSKTGYLTEALFCLVVQGSGKHEHRIAVVLGSPSEWDSMNDVRALLEVP